MKCSIQLPINFQLEYCKLKDQNFFFLSKKDFFLIPKAYSFIIKNNLLILFCKNICLKADFSQFVSSLYRIITKNGRLFLKKLLLKGLGLKAALSGEGDVLELKLGFSHLITISIPLKKIQIKLIKNGLLIYGNNLVSVCNFIYKIKSLKLPNIYKGKGIWYKNETMRLKEIKKS